MSILFDQLKSMALLFFHFHSTRKCLFCHDEWEREREIERGNKREREREREREILNNNFYFGVCALKSIDNDGGGSNRQNAAWLGRL